MLKKTLLLLIALAVASMAVAEPAIQTDWSGGAGISGPVLNWGISFDTESGVNWYSSTGELSLDYASPLEHSVSGYSNVNQARPVDIDGDHDMDILGAAGRYAPPYFFSGRIDWWENADSLGTSWIHHTLDDNFTSAPSICSADLDGDGDMDVVGGAQGSINYLTWWENVNSLGTIWTEHIITSSFMDVSAVDTTDVNGDGYVDLLCASTITGVRWVENVDGSGTNWTEHYIGYSSALYDVHGADIDGDDDVDVIVPAYNGDSILWWENVDGSGIDWIEHVVVSDFNGARSAFAADLDGDDDLDILGAASLEWAVAWWENSDGTGDSWIEHPIRNNFNFAFSVYACDMDEDGDMDALGAAYHHHDVVWWENIDGSGLNWVEHLVEGDFDGALDVITADMDGDSDPDIIGAAYADADISWWDVRRFVGSGELVSSILDIEVAADGDSLTWTSGVPPETSMYFQVRSSTDPQNMGDWSLIITTPGSLENYLNDGDRYIQYKAILETTNPGFSPVLEDITISWSGFTSGIDDEYSDANAFQLLPNYPNPFNPHTIVTFSVNRPQRVSISVYDTAGRRVAVLTDQVYGTGTFSTEWKGTDTSDRAVSSGIYLVRMVTEGGSESQKVMLVQ